MIAVVGVGAGGHAKVVLEILRAMSGYQVVALVDPNEQLWGKSVLGVPVIGNDDRLEQLLAEGVRHAFVGLGAIGDTLPRARLFAKVSDAGFRVVDAVHPSAIISPSVRMGAGVTVMAAAIINADALLGSNVVVNTAAVVEHECEIGDDVHIATGAKLASTVKVGQGAHIGVGATVRQCVRVGARSIVGAGAVVVGDVPENVVVVGVPARVMRQRG